MSVNKHKPHILILPEDDANAEFGNGFSLVADTRRLQVLPSAGGWQKLLSTYQDDYEGYLAKFPNSFMVLLMDLDKAGSHRLEHAQHYIQARFQDRVFVLSSQDEAEALSRALGKTEEAIGKLLAEECLAEKWEVWCHSHLEHNLPAAQKLHTLVKSFLFGGQPRAGG